MKRSTVLRTTAGVLLVAGTIAVAPAPVGAQQTQLLTITKAVEGTPGDTEYDFVVDCEGESTGVEFTLTDGDSITLEDIDDLGVLFADGIECVILEREGDDPPDEVTAEGTIDFLEPSGAPVGVGDATEPLTITSVTPQDGYVAQFEFTTLADDLVDQYDVDVTNIFEDTPPSSTSSSTSSSTTSSSTTSTTRATSTTTAAVATTATPRFTG